MTEFRQRFEVAGISAKLEIDDSLLSTPKARKSTILPPVVNGDSKTPPVDTWLNCMEGFRLVMNAATNSDMYKAMAQDAKHEVTVALIDDGVDGELNYRTYGGQSVYKQRGTNMSYPYYQSGSGHGTQMAKLITRVCPVAKLFVVRLKDQESPMHPGSRRIDAHSAAAVCWTCHIPQTPFLCRLLGASADSIVSKAIRAAVKRKVQIISMSWTLEPPVDEQARAALDEAIASADKANILMFCSASDQGAVQTETYPSKATKKIFTIGAANSTGHINPRVGNQWKVDYIFPGDRIDLGRLYPDTLPDEVTGSSAATALASGFAALIYHCARVRWLYYRQVGNAAQEHSARQDLEYMHKNRYDVMKDLFKSSVWGGENDDYQYLKVWRVFPRSSQELTNQDDNGLKGIADIGKTLGESARKIPPPTLGL